MGTEWALLLIAHRRRERIRLRRPFNARARQSESYRFLSLSFFVCVLESPPVGV